jgi:hypothetical protein
MWPIHKCSLTCERQCALRYARHWGTVGVGEWLTGVDVLDESGQMGKHDATVVPEARHSVHSLFCLGRCGGGPR